MPLNNEYKRYFIILQEDDKGYEIGAGKVPTGYVKIEIKNGRGKLTAYAQNVKPIENVDYRMILIAPSKKAAVDMGRLMVDGTGRGELNVEFDADNVVKSGMNVSEFMVAAISTNSSIPLSGFTGRDKVQWKNAYHIVNKPQDRGDKKGQQLQEIVSPTQAAPMQPMQQMPAATPMAPAAQMPQMPQMPEMPAPSVGEMVEGAKNIIGNVVETAKDVVGNVVEEAKDVVGDVIEGAQNVAENVVEDVVAGAKNIVGGVMQGVQQGMQNVMEYMVDEDEVKQLPVKPLSEGAPMQPMAQMPQMPQMQPMQPMQSMQGLSPAKAKKEHIPLQTVTQPVTMQPTQPHMTPKKETVPIQNITQPIITHPVTPKKETVPIQTIPQPIPVQPKPQPAPVQPIVQPAPVVPPAPVQPIQMMPQKPMFEAQTEIKAKFVIETEEMPKPKAQCPYEVQCPPVDLKDLYYEEECECDSDSDSDSDDKHKECEKEKHHKHHAEHEKEEQCEDEKHHENPMHKRLEKVLGRLREYEPFNDDDDSRERWLKVGDDVYLLNSATVPFMGGLMPLGYPFMSNECAMMIGRRDYIIGVRYEREHKDKKRINAIMFGIPGMNNKREERYYSMRGFVHFRPHKSKNYGYWIMIVDLETGEIMMK